MQPELEPLEKNRSESPPRILVLAGVNGAGKSSIAGAFLRARPGGDYFNPDERARQILAEDPALRQVEANSRAWREGVDGLRKAILNRENYSFETTLGGSETILGLLERAADEGFEVFIWYAGLDSPERHIERVRRRVKEGGHDIPEDMIRKRYHQSHLNLIRLLPRVSVLQVYDNSQEAPPPDLKPRPQLILQFERQRVLRPSDSNSTPAWAMPIVTAAFQLQEKD